MSGILEFVKELFSQFASGSGSFIDIANAQGGWLVGRGLFVLVWLLSVLFFAQHRLSVLTEQFPAVFPASFFGAVWLPVMIFLLDLLNENLSLPLFANAKLQTKTRF